MENQGLCYRKFLIGVGFRRSDQKYPQLSSNKKFRDSCQALQEGIGGESSPQTQYTKEDFFNLFRELKVNPGEIDFNEKEVADQIKSSYEAKSGDLNLSISTPWSDRILEPRTQ